MEEFHKKFNSFEKKVKMEKENEKQNIIEKRILLQKKKFYEQYPNLSFNDLQIKTSIFKRHDLPQKKWYVDMSTYMVTNGDISIATDDSCIHYTHSCDNQTYLWNYDENKWYVMKTI